MSFDTTGVAPGPYVLEPALGFVKQESKKFSWGFFSQNVL